jgi:DNA-binding CsgD family transcriptional regulator
MPPRPLGPQTFDWWLAQLARAGYRFGRVQGAVGTEPQDLIAAVDQRRGIGLAMADFLPAASLGTRVVARPLDPQLPLAQTVLVWPSNPAPELEGVIAVARTAAQKLRARHMRPPRGERSPTFRMLTARELEILRLAAEGLSAPTIAAGLTISVATVRSHFDNIYRKLGTNDRASAVAAAFRQGLIS